MVSQDFHFKLFTEEVLMNNALSCIGLELIIETVEWDSNGSDPRISSVSCQ